MLIPFLSINSYAVDRAQLTTIGSKPIERKSKLKMEDFNRDKILFDKAKPSDLQSYLDRATDYQTQNFSAAETHLRRVQVKCFLTPGFPVNQETLPHDLSMIAQYYSSQGLSANSTTTLLALQKRFPEAYPKQHWITEQIPAQPTEEAPSRTSVDGGALRETGVVVPSFSASKKSKDKDCCILL
jgi:hypothetical protein